MIREWSGGDLIGLVEDEAAQLRHDTAGRRPATHSLIYPYLLSRSWVTILRAAGRPLALCLSRSLARFSHAHPLSLPGLASPCFCLLRLPQRD